MASLTYPSKYSFLEYTYPRPTRAAGTENETPQLSAKKWVRKWHIRSYQGGPQGSISIIMLWTSKCLMSMGQRLRHTWHYCGTWGDTNVITWRTSQWEQVTHIRIWTCMYYMYYTGQNMNVHVIKWTIQIRIWTYMYYKYMYGVLIRITLGHTSVISGPIPVRSKQIYYYH